MTYVDHHWVLILIVSTVQMACDVYLFLTGRFDEAVTLLRRSK